MSVEDVRALMRARKLPDGYAAQFIAAARGNRWWSNSIGCVRRVVLASVLRYR